MLRSLAIASVFVSLVASLCAEDATVGAVGEVALLRVERDDLRFDVQVTPPPDRAVSKRVLAWLSGVEDAKGVADDDDPMDLSGYMVRVSAPKTAGGAACSGKFTLRPKPVKLQPDRGWSIKSHATFVSVTAYPTKGNVDAAVFRGPDDESCDVSRKGPGQMDHAGCLLTLCSNNDGPDDDYTGWVANYSTAQATYVGVISIVFVALP